MNSVKDAQARYNLTQRQIDEYLPLIQAKFEPVYQKEAFLNLVTLPFQAAKEEFGDLRIEQRTADLINHRIRDKVWEWVDKRCHLGSEFTLDQFLWTVTPSPGRDNMVPLVFPDILRQLRQGVAPIRLFRPKYEAMLGMIHEELQKTKMST